MLESKRLRQFIVLVALAYMPIGNAAPADVVSIEIKTDGVAADNDEFENRNGQLINNVETNYPNKNLKISVSTVNKYAGDITLEATADITVTHTIDKTIENNNDIHPVAGDILFNAGGSNILKNNIRTKGNQEYIGSVSLDAGLTLNGQVRILAKAKDANKSTVIFRDKIDSSVAGLSSLVVNADAPTFHKSIGSQKALDKFFVGGDITLKAPTVTTTDIQQYLGPVSLDATDVTNETSYVFTGKTIRFDNELDNVSATFADITVEGNAEFRGSVGAGDDGSFTHVEVIGTTLTSAPEIHTILNQDYGGKFTLAKDVLLETAVGTVAFKDFVVSENKADGSSKKRNLNIVSDAIFHKSVGSNLVDNNLGENELGKLTIDGEADVRGAFISTASDQLFKDGVKISLAPDHPESLVTTLRSGGKVTFSSTLDSKAKVVGGVQEIPSDVPNEPPLTDEFQVTISSFGDVTFGGAVGGINPLRGLQVTGNTKINGGLVATVFGQRYLSSVVLNSASDTTTLSSTDRVIFESTLDGSVENAESLIVDNATTFFFNDVGAFKKLKSVVVNNPESYTDIYGDVKTSEHQIYQGDVHISENIQRQKANYTLAGSDVTIAGKLIASKFSDDVGQPSLTIDGNAHFGGTVGGPVNGEDEFGRFKNITVNGTTSIVGGQVITTNDQTYGGAVFLQNNAANNPTTIFKGDNIKFNNTVDGDNASSQDLVVQGNVEFNAIVGLGAALNTITVTGDAVVDSVIFTEGNQRYNKLNLRNAAVLNLLNGDVNYNELTIGNSPGMATINGDLVLEEAATTFFELGGYDQGDDYDYLDVNGTAVLDGLVAISFLELFGSEKFNPFDGATFDLLTADTITGEFNLMSPQVNSYDLTLEYLHFIDSPDILRLSVVQYVPLPAALWLFSFGWLGLAAVGRRRF